MSENKHCFRCGGLCTRQVSGDRVLYYCPNNHGAAFSVALESETVSVPVPAGTFLDAYPQDPSVTGQSIEDGRQGPAKDALSEAVDRSKAVITLGGLGFGGVDVGR